MNLGILLRSNRETRAYTLRTFYAVHNRNSAINVIRTATCIQAVAHRYNFKLISLSIKAVEAIFCEAVMDYLMVYSCAALVAKMFFLYLHDLEVLLFLIVMIFHYFFFSTVFSFS